MRVLGLGSPDKVPPLTEKAAIELGGDILSEFFVFGTAVALILIEYSRQASNKTIKDNQLNQKVEDLEKDNQTLKETIQANAKRLSEISSFIQEQKLTIDDLNKKVSQLNVKKKHATQATQTTNGRQIGKVILPKTATQTASNDVKNSIMYQCTDSAVNELIGNTKNE
jgi:succinate dehydrogenase/fumarate reductase flavoprotein subunit